MNARLKGLLVKEIIQFLRDRVMLLLVLYFYTGCVLICAYALSFDVRDLPLSIVDMDETVASRSLAERFSVNDAFLPVGHLHSMSEAGAWLQNGRAAVALVIPKGFQKGLEQGVSAQIQILLDGSNSNSAAQARGYALQIIEGYAEEYAEPSEPLTARVMPAVRVWYNPDLSYRIFMVLSMIATAALIVGVIYPAASIVREREAGTIEQLRVTPISVGEIFIAKTVPMLAMGLLAIFPGLLIVWWFGVPFRGNLLFFLFMTGLFLLSAIALGVLVGVVTRTLQQALLLGFFGLFPLLFLSGTIAPIESMPAALQTASLISPVRHYMDVILGVFLKGSGIAELWSQALFLAVIAAILFAVAMHVFRRSWR